VTRPTRSRHRLWGPILGRRLQAQGQHPARTTGARASRQLRDVVKKPKPDHPFVADAMRSPNSKAISGRLGCP
jgi:hypothetical protein